VPFTGGVIVGLIGIDAGTTGCKAAIIDFEGNAQKQAYREYNPESVLDGPHEINSRLPYGKM